MVRPPARSRLRRLLARFEQARSGSTAVEFAILALPFLALLFAIIELGMIYLIATTLSNATTDIARQIRTCQLQGTVSTQKNLETDICNDGAMAWLGASCTGNIYSDSTVYTTFSAANSATSPISSKTLNMSSNNAVSLGAAGDIVLLRTYYTWGLVAPGLDGLVAQLSNGQFVVEAAAVFRNEPCS
ncbi:MAG: pilus assembly protein [Caulobacteraceae bacterium]|nr:pilus assembly protein [Caulobacteraceae bacterium]